MLRTRIVVLLALVVLAQACIVMENRYTAVPPGQWRAILKLKTERVAENAADDKVLMEEATEGELPFNFEVVYTTDTTFYLEVQNGEERIKLDDIVYGKNRRTGKDTIRIEFPLYESYISAVYEEDIIEGHWVVKTRKNYRIPFVAFHGEAHRFTQLKKTPQLDLTGLWEVTFGLDTDNPYKAAGEFKQEGNYLTGTFRTETGDYRYLEGTVQDQKVYLSCFDGSHAFLFEAKILEDNTMIGSFRSGKHYQTTWDAKRNPDFVLGDPDDLTYLKEGYDAFSFAFADAQGETISLEHEKYADKVKLVQIFGTWCPNCKDETRFLVDYLKDNAHPDLAVIGLAFEKHRDIAKAYSVLDLYQKKMDIPYELLVAGYANKKEAAEALPMLNAVIAYPTLLFIDRDNQVRRIHTGFSGPATTKYQDFVQDFDGFVKSLLNEE